MTIKKANPLFLIITFLGFISALTSCEKEDNSQIGMNIIPGGDRISLHCDTINGTIYTIKTDSVSVADKTLAPLGTIYDPVFGSSKASFATQFKLSATNVNFGQVNHINSIELQLKLYSCYGDSITPQTVDIYRLRTDLNASTDHTYYSDFKFNTGDIEHIKTSTLSYDSGDTARIVKIELPISLAEEFTNSANSGYFVNDTVFAQFFKGLYITPNGTPSGNGGIFSFGIIDKNTKILMKYNDTVEFSFNIDKNLAIVKMFEHDYSQASQDLTNTINNPSDLHDYSYIQGLGGMMTKVYFPDLKTLFDSTNISINRAMLTVNVKNNNDYDIYAPPPKLAIMKRSSSGSLVLINDYINSKSFGGDFNSTYYTYSFNISVHLQSLLKTNQEDSEIYILPLPARNIGTPHRVILYGNSDEEKKPKLELYYSKY